MHFICNASGLVIMRASDLGTQIWIKSSRGLRYTTSTTFDTFPFPAEVEHLEILGRDFDALLGLTMRVANLGATNLYALVNDPDVPDIDGRSLFVLREMHAALDRAVIDAYGWSDILLDHGFHTYRQMTRWTVSPAARVEILDRLLEDNHRRAAAESAAGLGAKKGRKKSLGSAAGDEEGLF